MVKCASLTKLLNFRLYLKQHFRPTRDCVSSWTSDNFHPLSTPLSHPSPCHCSNPIETATIYSKLYLEKCFRFRGTAYNTIVYAFCVLTSLRAYNLMLSRRAEGRRRGGRSVSSWTLELWSIDHGDVGITMNGKRYRSFVDRRFSEL